MPVTGIRSDPGDSGWQRELAETGALALPGEVTAAAAEVQPEPPGDGAGSSAV